MVRETRDRFAAATQCRITTEVELAFTPRCMAFCSTHSVGSAFETIARVLAHGLAMVVGVTCKVAGTVTIAVRARVWMSASLTVRVANETKLANTLVSARYVNAFCRRMTWV